MSRLPSASLRENVELNQTLIVPNALQGLFRRRPTAVAVATRLDVDGRAIGLLRRLRKSHGHGPLWVRIVRDRALLVLTPEDAEHALGGSPHPFAADPPAKRRGMAHFQPDALTLSRGELWRNRRRFTEAVLDGASLERAAAIARDEVAALASPLSYRPLQDAFARIARRIVLGQRAREDEEVSRLLGELMSEANGLPSERSPQLDQLMERLEDYVREAEPGSLTALAADAPADADTRVAGQLPHWLFATTDTLSANVLRAVALLASHPEQRHLAAADDAYRTACLQEAMRLWPTTPLLSRETVTDVVWNGVAIPAGTQVLIPNAFLHRDRDRLDYADSFAPEAWTSGDAASYPGFNHFSRGPQGCPGERLALHVGSAALEPLLDDPRLLEPRLDPARPLPRMLDYFRIRVAVA